MRRNRLFHFLFVLFLIPLTASLSESSEVIIVGDIRLKPVNDIVATIQESLTSEAPVYLPKNIKGALSLAVKTENAKVVIVLGSEPIEDALSLPESVSVVYGLLIKPLNTKRRNITGVHMTTPVSEYVSLLERYFPNISRLGIVVEPETREVLQHEVPANSVTFYRAMNSYEFIKGINQLNRGIDAYLLIPERNLLTATAMEELYRLSFTEKVPVLGVSEKHVKMGSLLALVFDETGMGRQIGELAQKVLAAGNASGMLPAAPSRYNLYLNVETARAMNINVPAELARKARGIYP